MFVHHTRLEPQLVPSDYTSDASFDAERSAIFEQQWHFVGLTGDLSSPDDYIAADVLGVPVVCRNIGGELRAFQNVCVHRHSRIVPAGAGHRRQLRCQYHGWEYGDEGQVAKIPDGKSFKGIRTAGLCLQRYRVERLGSLVFVNLSATAPGLRESLDDLTAELDYFFGDHYRIWHWINEYPVNWKVIVENAVESYHVPMLHPSTFMDYKKEEHHEHRLHPAFTSYLDTAPMGNSVIETGFRSFTALTAKTIHFERAKHIHVFPNHLFEVREVYSLFSTLEPLAAGRTRLVSMGFLPRDIKFPFVNRPIQRLFGRTLTHMIRKIAGEDVGIWSEVQQGLRHSSHTGILGSREERVYAFQQHLAERLHKVVDAGPGGS